MHVGSSRMSDREGVPPLHRRLTMMMAGRADMMVPPRSSPTCTYAIRLHVYCTRTPHHTSHRYLHSSSLSHDHTLNTAALHRSDLAMSRPQGSPTSITPSSSRLHNIPISQPSAPNPLHRHHHQGITTTSTKNSIGKYPTMKSRSEDAANGRETLEPQQLFGCRCTSNPDLPRGGGEEVRRTLAARVAFVHITCMTVSIFATRNGRK